MPNVAGRHVAPGIRLSRNHQMAEGIVKFFNTTKGFGFIQPTNGGKDAFVHISAVERSGCRTLNEGQKVSYELQTGRDGKESADQSQGALSSLSGLTKGPVRGAFLFVRLPALCSLDVQRLRTAGQPRPVSQGDRSARTGITRSPRRSRPRVRFASAIWARSFAPPAMASSSSSCASAGHRRVPRPVRSSTSSRTSAASPTRAAA